MTSVLYLQNLYACEEDPYIFQLYIATFHGGSYILDTFRFLFPKDDGISFVEIAVLWHTFLKA